MLRRTLFAGAAVAALAALAAYAGAHAGRGRDRPDLPPAIGAYADGGEPARDAALEDVLAERLAMLAVDTDEARYGQSAGEQARVELDRELRGDPAIARLGPGPLAAWQRLLDALSRWSDTPRGDRANREAVHELRRRSRGFTDQLAALGLGYYVDADVLVSHGSAHAMVLVYRVEQVAFVHAGDERRRVLELRRLDRLNAERHLLGMQSEELGDPVVLLDQVDDFVAQRLQPVLAGGPYDLGQPTASVRRLGWAAGEAVRRELAGQGPIAELVAATVRRHEARHAIDLERDEPLRAPPPLAVLVGPHLDDRFARRARAELSAYLSQIANEPVAPQLALWNLATQAFHPERWGSPESYVAVVVLEGLARRAGQVAPRPCVENGQLDRMLLAQLALSLASLTDDELRIHARALWHEFYGETLLRIE